MLKTSKKVRAQACYGTAIPDFATDIFDGCKEVLGLITINGELSNFVSEVVVKDVETIHNSLVIRVCRNVVLLLYCIPLPTKKVIVSLTNFMVENPLRNQGPFNNSFRVQFPNLTR